MVARGGRSLRMFSATRPLCTCSRPASVLHLMAHYGVRPSEIITLTPGSIDWEAKRLRVKQCKTRSDLMLPLVDQTLRILRHYLRCERPGGGAP